MYLGDGAPAEFIYRFELPFERCGGTNMEFERLGNGNVKAKIVKKRKDSNTATAASRVAQASDYRHPTHLSIGTRPYDTRVK